MTFQISKPNPRDRFRKDVHLDHLVVFVEPTAQEEPRLTGDGTQVAARCSYVGCVTCELVVSQYTVFGAALGPRIAGAGEIVAGRLTRGQASAGRSAPFLLDDPTDKDVRAVEKFLTKYARRDSSGRISLKVPTERKKKYGTSDPVGDDGKFDDDDEDLVEDDIEDDDDDV